MQVFYLGAFDTSPAGAIYLFYALFFVVATFLYTVVNKSVENKMF